MHHSRQKGFSIIELLVVISIIGVLTAIITIGLADVRSKGRDSKRIADVVSLSLSLELAYDACGVYPPNLNAATQIGGRCPSAIRVSEFISTTPTPPGGGSYDYAVNGGRTSFVLRTQLEVAGSLPDDDLNGTQLGLNCNGTFYCKGS